MIGTDRSFEHRGYAVHRSHLMPVEGSTWSRVHDAAFHGPEKWWKSLLMWLLIGSAAIVVLAVVA